MSQPKAVQSLRGFAWRNILSNPLRSLLSAAAVMIAVSITLASEQMGRAVLNGFSDSRDVQIMAAGIFGQFESVMSMLGLIVSAAAAFMIFNAILMSVTQRRQQIGALRALGMTRRQVMILVLTESLIISGAGAVFGLISGPLLGAGLIAFIGFIGGEIFNAFGDAPLSFERLVFSAGLGIGLTLLASLFPARQAARLSPLVALGSERSGGIERSPRWRLFLGGGLFIGLLLWLAIAPPAHWVSPPLDWQLLLAVTFLFFFSIGLLFPNLIEACTDALRQPLQSRFGAVGRLAVDNLSRSRGRVTLTTAALAIGTALIIGVTGMMQFFLMELFGPRFLAGAEEQVIAVFPFDFTEGASSYATLDSIALPKETVDIFLDVIGEDGTSFEWRFLIVPELAFMMPDYFSYMVDPKALQASGTWVFEFAEGDWDNAMPLMQDGCGLLLSRMVASANGAGLYDRITVTGLDGPVDCVVAGIGNSFANASIIGISSQAFFDVGEPMALLTQANMDRVTRTELMERMQATAATMPGAHVLPMEEMTRLQFSALDYMTAAMNAILILAFIAAALGVVNTTVMSVTERRQEFGMLRAIGATRRQIRQIVSGEAALIGLIGALVGIVAGAGFTIILATVYGGSAFAIDDLDVWGAAFRSLQPAFMTALVALFGAPLVSLAAAWLPVRQILRGSAIDTMDARRKPEQASEQQGVGLRSLNGLAWRNLREESARTLLGILSVAVGVSITIASDVMTRGLLNAMGEGSVMAEFIGTISIFLGMTGFIVSGAAGFIVYNTLTMAVTQRQQEIGALRALGMTRQQITRQVLIEAGVIGLFGTLLGLGIGPGIGQGMLIFLEQTGLDPGSVSPSLVMMLLAALFGAGVSLIAGWIPARRAAHIPPILAVRQARDTGDAIVIRPWRTALGLGIAASITSLMIIAPPHQYMGTNLPDPLFMWVVLFGLWGLVATAFFLLMPVMIHFLLVAIRSLALRAGGISGRLAIDNLQRSSNRVTVLSVTFAVGIGIVLWTGGQVDFTNSALTYNAERYLAELSFIATPINPEDALAQLNSFGTEDAFFIDEEIAAIESAVEGYATLSYAYQVVIPEISAPVPGFPSILTDAGYLQREGAYTFTEGDWETALPVLESGCGLLISSNAAGRLGGGLGELVTITGKDGPVSCRIAGIGTGGTIPVSFVSLAARNAFISPDQRPDTLNIRPLPEAKPDELEAALTALEERYPGEVFIYRSEDAVASVLQVSDQLSAAFSLLQVLAIVAAALGVANTTLQSILERRQEIGLLRAVGSTRQQVMRTITGEALITGLIGATLGIVLGTAMTFVYGFTVGGTGLGIDGLPVFSATLRAALTSLRYGAMGIILSPLLAVFAAYLPARNILRGNTIETLKPEMRQSLTAGQRFTRAFRWGSIRQRYALGTAALMVILIGVLIEVVVIHASNYLQDLTLSAFESMATWNSSLIELSLPDEVSDLTLEDIQAANSFSTDFDILNLGALVSGMQDLGIDDVQISNREGLLIMSLSVDEIGTSIDLPESRQTPLVSTTRDRDDWTYVIYTPIKNSEAQVIGATRITGDLHLIREFSRRLRNTLRAIGIALTLLAVGLAYWMASPLSQAARDLTTHATVISDGHYTPYPSRKPRLQERVSLKTRLTVMLVMILILTMFSLQIAALPIERNQVEDIASDSLLLITRWQGDAISSMLDESSAQDFAGQISPLDLLSEAGNMDLLGLQSVMSESPTGDLVYTAYADMDGKIIYTDTGDLVDTLIPVVTEATVSEGQYEGKDIWTGSTPITAGTDGEQIGVLQSAIYSDRLFDILDEAAMIFRFAAIIAILSGVLLAQVIGEAVTAPARQLASGARQVGDGDLSVTFDERGGDELAQLAAAYNRMVIGLQEREQLRDLFGRFVSPDVAEAIRHGQLQLGGENRIVSILFCDIRGFTAFSETRPPQDVVRMLNTYLPLVVAAAQAHEGTVNKFGGDSVLVIYGAPRLLENHAEQAIRTALHLRVSLEALNDIFERQGLPPIRIGVGINTGRVIAGAIGSQERQEYTVIGDTVNLASRIEALNKEYPQHDILISQWTYEALGEAAEAFNLVDLGEVPIRGKVDVIRIWAVAGLR